MFNGFFFSNVLCGLLRNLSDESFKFISPSFFLRNEQENLVEYFVIDLYEEPKRANFIIETVEVLLRCVPLHASSQLISFYTMY